MGYHRPPVRSTIGTYDTAVRLHVFFSLIDVVFLQAVLQVETTRFSSELLQMIFYILQVLTDEQYLRP